MATIPPFELFSLRFGRSANGRRVMAEVDVERRPLYPGTDWDAIRDAANPAASHAAVAVLAGRTSRLDLFGRFFRFPAVQTWEIWAEDIGTGSPAPRITRRRLRDDLPGCVSREVQFGVELATDAVGRFDVAWKLARTVSQPFHARARGKAGVPGADAVHALFDPRPPRSAAMDPGSGRRSRRRAAAGRCTHAGVHAGAWSEDDP